jgi:hypothetical protein
MEKRIGVYRLWWRNLSERGHSEYLGAHRIVILQIYLTEILLDVVDWIDLA